MFDGIQLTYNTKSNRLINSTIWEVLVNEQSGSPATDFKTANFRNLNLTLKPSLKGGYILLLNGSIHKFYNEGKHNANDFVFSNVCDTINCLTTSLFINPNQCFIHGLEIGINITLPYSPIKILKNIVCYKGKVFTQINKRNIRKGFICCLTDYDIKLYDKAVQSGIDCGNVLRLEIHLHKMRMIEKYNIKTIEDLKDYSKTYPLIELLTNVLDSIIWKDESIKLSSLNNREQKQYLAFTNPLTWQNLNKHKAFTSRKKINELIKKYGNKIDLKPLVINAWDNLFSEVLAAIKQQPFHRPILENAAIKNTTFSPLECTGKRLLNDLDNSPPTITTFEPSILTNNLKKDMIKKSANTTQNKVRKCLTCKKDISNQKQQSIFCSEKVYGKKAKHCRNVDSNRRRTLKRRICKATIENKYLAISYKDANGLIYTNILHPSKITITKKLLDNIQNILVLKQENKKE